MKTPESGKDTNVLRKTPEEIKKELRNAKHVQCMDISDGENERAGTNYGVLVGYVLRDKIYSYITQLESTVSQVSKALCGKENATLEEILQAASQVKSRLAQAERERDAAVDSLRGECFECVWHESMCDKCASCVHSADAWNVNVGNWEWRGVCPEAPKEE